MIELTITAPDKPLTANMRVHHHERARIVHNWRLRTALLARKQPHLAHAHVTFYVSHGDAHRRRRDVSNYILTAKAALDGVVDAGVLEDDSDRYVVGPDPRLGPITTEFILTLVLDDACTCADCATRFGIGGAA